MIRPPLLQGPCPSGREARTDRSRAFSNSCVTGFARQAGHPPREPAQGGTGCARNGHPRRQAVTPRSAARRARTRSPAGVALGGELGRAGRVGVRTVRTRARPTSACALATARGRERVGVAGVPAQEGQRPAPLVIAAREEREGLVADPRRAPGPVGVEARARAGGEQPIGEPLGARERRERERRPARDGASSGRQTDHEREQLEGGSREAHRLAEPRWCGVADQPVVGEDPSVSPRR